MHVYSLLDDDDRVTDSFNVTSTTYYIFLRIVITKEGFLFLREYIKLYTGSGENKRADFFFLSLSSHLLNFYLV